MTQALMPEVLREFTTRWGVQPAEIAGLLGTTPEAVAEAIVEDREPEGMDFRGALLAGAAYFVLDERSNGAGSDAAVAAWLKERIEGELRLKRLSRATSVNEIGVALGISY